MYYKAALKASCKFKSWCNCSARNSILKFGTSVDL